MLSTRSAEATFGLPSNPRALDVEARWYACYTRSRHEKQVEGLLARRGVESYLPLVPRVRRWKDRKKTVPWPLFPGYVFGRFSLGEVHTVLATPGVSTIVRVDGRPTPIPDAELENVRVFAEAAARMELEPKVVPLPRKGEWVRIVEGGLRGVEGRVVDRRGRHRLLVALHAVGRGLEVDVDARLLQVIARPSWVKA